MKKETRTTKTRKPGRFRAGYFMYGLGLVIAAILFSSLHTFIPTSSSGYEAQTIEIQRKQTKSLESSVVVTHIQTPEPVKAIYMTSWVGGAVNDSGEYYWRESLMDFIDETEINALVVDIKDATGRISFEVNHEELVEIGAGTNRIPDIKEFISELHDRGIYVIGRISVFQDPHLAKLRPELAVKRVDNGEIWKDHQGIAWLDAGAKDVWRYARILAQESYSVGFDEINFDYVRFPSDGNMSNVSYDHYDNTITKAQQMEKFYSYLGKTLRDRRGIPISADLFGMTTVAQKNFDLSIGQVLENALPHFDAVAPMVYPSHYPPGFHGYSNPNEVPYEIVYESMLGAVEKAKAAGQDPAKLRAWLQDFDYGGIYDEADVRAQKQAVYDAGLTSWMIWDPAVKYTRSAFDKE